MLPATFTTFVICLILISIGIGILVLASRGGNRRCPNPHCSHVNPLNARFCAHCGENLDQSAPRGGASDDRPSKRDLDGG